MKKGFLQVQVRLIAGLIIGAMFLLLFIQLIQQQNITTETRENQRIITQLQNGEDTFNFTNTREVRYDCQTNTFFLENTAITLPLHTVAILSEQGKTEKIHLQQTAINYPFFIGYLTVIVPDEELIAISGTNTQLAERVIAFFPEQKALVTEKNIDEENRYQLIIRHGTERAIGVDATAIHFLERTGKKWVITTTREREDAIHTAVAVLSDSATTYDCSIEKIEERVRTVSLSYEQKSQTLDCRQEQAEILLQALQQKPSYENMQALHNFNQELKAQGCQTLY